MAKRAAVLIVMGLFIFGCSRAPRGGKVLASFPLDNLNGLIIQSGAQIDQGVSADGKGSLRLKAAEPLTVPLFEIRDIGVDNARLVYQARLRVEHVIGQVYLEMLCHFPEKGEFFSRGQMTLLSGTTDWTSQEIAFFLQKGESPDLVKLNLVINGSGTVWIDDIKLLKMPLNP